MSRIQEAFTGGKAFIPFITAGYPDLETTRAALIEAQENGADLIEIGIPFSDPTAEGPVIQTANVRALDGGITTDMVLVFIREVSEDGTVTVPMVFMTYANVIYSYHEGGEGDADGSDGSDRGRYGFCRRCAEVGIDGLILPDVPFEEKDQFEDACRQNGIDLISLIAPTSEDRIVQIASEAQGFIYVVSSLGVTGVRTAITTDIGSITSKIREVTDVPGPGSGNGGCIRRGDRRLRHHPYHRPVWDRRPASHRGVCAQHEGRHAKLNRILCPI